MTTSSVTRSIEIHAPVEEVFAFVSDPRRRNGAVERAFKRRIVVTDVQTSPEGVITGWKGTMRILLPGTTWVIPFDIPIRTNRLEHIPNQRIREQAPVATKDVDDVAFEPTDAGTRLTWHAECSSRIPYLEKVGLLLSARRGYGAQIDLALVEFKRELEASSGGQPRESVPGP